MVLVRQRARPKVAQAEPLEAECAIASPKQNVLSKQNHEIPESATRLGPGRRKTQNGFAVSYFTPGTETAAPTSRASEKDEERLLARLCIGFRPDQYLFRWLKIQPAQRLREGQKSRVAFLA